MRTFTSESVTVGHPDKLADQISDAVLDAVLSQDPNPAENARVACETVLTTGLCMVTGEIRTKADWVNIPEIARSVICSAGYDSHAVGFDGNTCGVLSCMSPQSDEIHAGVDSKDGLKAGDQGMMFGYACSETEGSLMPMPIYLAHKLAEKLASVRRNNTLGYLRPDGKTQVTVEYGERGKPAKVGSVLISTQHIPGINSEYTLKPDLAEHVVNPVLEEQGFGICLKNLTVNPNGEFTKGGPAADAGLTGRKIIVDTYGGMARHGGGAFSGKDPTKVDRSGSYAARWAAKNIVAAGLADRCEVRLSYAIGEAALTSFDIKTFGTAKPGIQHDKLEKAVLSVFDGFRPQSIINGLGLFTECRNWTYRQTSTYGHFGRDQFPWERTDRREDLLDALGSG